MKNENCLFFATSNINYFCGQISSTCVEGVKGNTLTNRQHLKKADFQNFQIKETNYTIIIIIPYNLLVTTV